MSPQVVRERRNTGMEEVRTCSLFPYLRVQHITGVLNCTLISGAFYKCVPTVSNSEGVELTSLCRTIVCVTMSFSGFVSRIRRTPR